MLFFLLCGFEMDFVISFRRLIGKEVSEVWKHIKHDQIIYLTILLFVLSFFSFSFYSGYVGKFEFFAYFYSLKIVIPISIISYCVYYFFKLIFIGERQPLKRFAGRVKLAYIYRSKLISAFVLLSAISIFMSSYSTMKSLIPIVNMFYLDDLLHQANLWIFLGHQPGLSIVKWLDNPFYLFIINFNYNLWFFLMWFIVVYFLIAKKSTNRTSFFISWIGCWGLLGAVLAMLLSSAGPVYVEKLDPTNLTYQPLMLLLQEKHSWLVEQGWPGLFSLNTQELLWLAYTENLEMLGSGISAMPSLHVSIAVLMALSMREENKFISYFLWFFTVIIFIGSFALGWHYFLDGIVGAPLTYLIWKFSLTIAKKSHSNDSFTRDVSVA